MEIKIVDFKETMIARLKHLGSSALVDVAVSNFIKWRKQTGLSPIKTSSTYGIVYGDPKTMAPEDFRFDVCGSIDKPIGENEFGIENSVIPAGKCALITHKGTLDNIDNSITSLCEQLLAKKIEKSHSFPCVFHYKNLISQVDKHELITDVYIRIK